MPRLRFTRADYDRIPEDLRVELIDGELLKMASPAVFHQRLVARLLSLLVDAAGEERVVVGPIDFAIDETNVLVPDLVGLAAPPARDARSIEKALIVIEVLSPSTAARDRTVKADLYLEAGVGEVWLVDPRSATVEVRTAGGVRTLRGAEPAESVAVPGFQVEPARLFG